MSTRGLYGFRLDGKDYLSYNHSDSYPAWLGNNIVSQLASLQEEFGIVGLKQRVRLITLVDEHNSVPTAEQINRCRKYADTDVGNQRIDDWYCLLRHAQGSLVAALDCDLMVDGHKFIMDSLFCEWAYIVNLDTAELEVWVGFQTQPDPTNRYGVGYDHDTQKSIGKQYYACKLIKTFPFTALDAAATWMDGRYDAEEGEDESTEVETNGPTAPDGNASA